MCVSVRLAWRTIEAAKLAISVADVSRIQVSVDIEKGGAPVFPATYTVGQFPQRRQIIGCKQRQSIFKREPLGAFNFFG